MNDGKSLFDLSDKVCLVTGANRGLGRAIAIGLAEAGGDVVVACRDKESGRAVAREIEALGRRALVVPCDIGRWPDLENLVTETCKTFGRIDVLVNNAGIGEYGPFVAKNPDDDARMMHLNMDVLVRLTHIVLPAMLERRCGWILNVASMASFQPCPYMGVYGATKAFVLNHSMALREELRGTGVTVTAVCPAGVKTEFFDRGGFDGRRDQFLSIACEPDFVADKAVNALRKRQAYVIPGLKNRLTVFIQRFVPLTTVTRVAAKILGPGAKK